MSALKKGQRVDKYEIEAEIGAGGMAVVYRVRHVILDTCFALKALDTARRQDAEVRERFLAEGRIAARLVHPNIVRVTDTVSTDDVAGLVMELVEGESLEQFIEALTAPPNADVLRAVMLPVLDAVGYAHGQGIIHRDLKPANILLEKTADGICPKVTDFGIAKIADGSVVRKKKPTQADERMGTLGYMSPEQIRRVKDVTQRSDIFSLGATFYELVTRRPAFDGESDFDVMEKIVHGGCTPPESLAPVAPEISAALTRALDPDPARRFGSCAEFAAALQASSPQPGYAPAVSAASGPVAARPTTSTAARAAVPAPVVPAASAPVFEPRRPPPTSRPGPRTGRLPRRDSPPWKPGLVLGATILGMVVTALIVAMVVSGSGPKRSTDLAAAVGPSPPTADPPSSARPDPPSAARTTTPAGQAGAGPRRGCEGLGADGEPKSCPKLRLPTAFYKVGNEGFRLVREGKLDEGICASLELVRRAKASDDAKRFLHMSIGSYNMAVGLERRGCRPLACRWMRQSFDWRRESNRPDLVKEQCQSLGEWECGPLPGLCTGAAPEAKPEPKVTPKPEAKAAPKPEPRVAVEDSAKKPDDIYSLMPSGATSPRRPTVNQPGGVPETLTPEQIRAGMIAVRGRIMACYDKYDVPGVARLTVKLGQHGRITSVSLSGDFTGTPTGDCVTAAVRSAIFPRFTGTPITVAYSYLLRR